MISPELRHKLETKILETLEVAERVYDRPFDIPNIEYRDMGRVAGKAFLHQNKVVYSPTLFHENQERFLNRTVPHEIAHLVTHRVYPFAKQAHGPEWRSVMNRLGVSDSSRCHSYDTSSVAKPRAKRSKNNLVICGCVKKHVTDTIYRRMLNGLKYKCGNCSKTLLLP